MAGHMVRDFIVSLSARSGLVTPQCKPKCSVKLVNCPQRKGDRSFSSGWNENGMAGAAAATWAHMLTLEMEATLAELQDESRRLTLQWPGLPPTI